MPRTLIAAFVVCLLALVAAPAWAHDDEVTPDRSTLPRAQKQAGKVATLARGSKTYRGTGTRTLGAVRLVRTATLTWTHPRGGRLRLVTGPRAFPLVTTVARRGSLKLRAGVYRNLRVLATGGWRVRLTIRTSR